MDRNRMNDSQTRELTDAELDAVSGGCGGSGGGSCPTETMVSSATGGVGAGGKTALIPAVQ
jgi:hypothetical protein